MSIHFIQDGLIASVHGEILHPGREAKRSRSPARVSAAKDAQGAAGQYAFLDFFPRFVGKNERWVPPDRLACEFDASLGLSLPSRDHHFEVLAEFIDVIPKIVWPQLNVA
jgi:hypothetical protein